MSLLRAFRATLAPAALAVAASAGAVPADCPKDYAGSPEIDPATGRETPAGKVARVQLEMVVNVIVSYEGCAADSSFVSTFGPSYHSWRSKFHDAVARYEKNARAKRYVQCGLAEERKRAAADTAEGKAQKLQVCHRLIGPGIENLAAQ